MSWFPGCAEERPQDTDPVAVSSISFSLTSSPLTGASVEICGTRTPADSRTTCLSMLPCTCYDAADTINVGGLCPSTGDTPGTWTFTYSVWTEPLCMGVELTDGTHDFACYDVANLESMMPVNQSVEMLSPGQNINQIACAVESAAKTWDVDGCTDITTVDEEAMMTLRLDCECTLAAGPACDCGPGGISTATLPAGCAFDLTTCDVVCSTTLATDLFVCNDAFYLAGTTGSPTLSTMSRSTLGVTQLAGVPSAFIQSALAWSSNGYIYGIDNGPTPHLVRFGQTTGTDLGPIVALAGKEWVIGTFLQDGTYLVGSTANDWARINVDTRTVVDSGTLPISNTMSWAVNPVDNKVYAYHPDLQQIEVFDPAGDESTHIYGAPLAIGDQDCEAAFTQAGEFLLYCETSNPAVNSLYQVSTDLSNITAMLLVNGGAPTSGVSALLSCPFGP